MSRAKTLTGKERKIKDLRQQMVSLERQIIELQRQGVAAPLQKAIATELKNELRLLFNCSNYRLHEKIACQLDVRYDLEASCTFDLHATEEPEISGSVNVKCKTRKDYCLEEFLCGEEEVEGWASDVKDISPAIRKWLNDFLSLEKKIWEKAQQIRDRINPDINDQELNEILTLAVYKNN